MAEGAGEGAGDGAEEIAEENAEQNAGDGTQETQQAEESEESADEEISGLQMAKPAVVDLPSLADETFPRFLKVEDGLDGGYQMAMSPSLPPTPASSPI